MLITMLMVNFVLLIFWQYDALQRGIDKDRAIVEHLRKLFPPQLSIYNKLPADHFSFQDFYPSSEAGQIYLYRGGKENVVTAVQHLQPELLANSLAESMYSGKTVIQYSGSFLGMDRAKDAVAVVVCPVLLQGQLVGAIGMSHSLTPMFSSLWRAEKNVLIYILINVLLWTVIGYFIMRRLIMLPIDRLVSLADQYQDNETALFSADAPASEFSVLATSLNSMLARIEQDRKSLAQNVAELATANSELKKQQQQMIRAEKLASVGRMAAGIAHEIGNPLGIVQGYLGLLKQMPQLEEEYMDFIERADDELHRVNLLLRQMLDFSRAPKGEHQYFSVHELLISVTEMVRMQPVFEGINLSVNLEADADVVRADPHQLRQVMVNCLINSADAVQAADLPGEGTLLLTTDNKLSTNEERMSSAPEFLRIHIYDNGIGIPKEQLELIFDPFFTTKAPGKGTGLGLSVSLSIIESAGGTMTMQSESGRGSELVILLPLASSAKQLKSITVHSA